MKKKIAILGSTGSIGKNTLQIIEKDKQNFKIELLSTNKNTIKIYNQAKNFNVKNLIIHDKETFIKHNDFFKKKKIRLFQSVIEYFQKNKKKKIRLHDVINKWFRRIDINIRYYKIDQKYCYCK